MIPMLSNTRLFALMLALMAMLLSAPASALDLTSAKEQGLVGETLSGYLESVEPAPSAAVLDLIEDINAKRKAKYREIAERNGTELAAVEKLAGKTAVEKTPAGQYIKLPSGEWVRK